MGIIAFGVLTSPVPNIVKIQVENSIANYVVNVPNMSAYEWGHDLSYGAVKLVEIWATRRVLPVAKASFGLKSGLGGSRFRFTTIQSMWMKGRFGSFSSPWRTIPFGTRTDDIGMFLNRNFIIPTGRAVGLGQLQYLQQFNRNRN